MLLGLSFFVILIYLIIGSIIGWLAGVIMQGKGFGFLGNITIAIVGSLIGGIFFRILGLHTHGFWSFISAVSGAILLLFIINLFKKN